MVDPSTDFQPIISFSRSTVISASQLSLTPPGAVTVQCECVASLTWTDSRPSINRARLVKSRQYRYNSSGERSTIMHFFSFTPGYLNALYAITPATVPAAAAPARIFKAFDVFFIFTTYAARS